MKLVELRGDRATFAMDPTEIVQVSPGEYSNRPCSVKLRDGHWISVHESYDDIVAKVNAALAAPTP